MAYVIFLLDESGVCYLTFRSMDSLASLGQSLPADFGVMSNGQQPLSVTPSKSPRGNLTVYPSHLSRPTENEGPLVVLHVEVCHKPNVPIIVSQLEKAVHHRLTRITWTEYQFIVERALRGLINSWF